MQVMILALDGPDSADRRAAARPAHVAGVRELARGGHLLDGGAVLDAEGRVVGSLLICEFPDAAAVDAYLKSEPYKTQGVWLDVQVRPVARVDVSALAASE